LRRSFNVIYIRYAQKVDIFPATKEFHEAQLERATVIPLARWKNPVSGGHR